jgi:Icc-related predicted phosphoesterase
MRIVLLSDTHRRHAEIAVPDGELLIHAGDFSGHGTRSQIQAFDDWLGTLPHPHKVVIAGNHDFLFEKVDNPHALLKNARYLQDEEVVIGGLRIWGSPWQPRFFDWAFNLDRGEPLRQIWEKVPSGIDILVTHGPPKGILDRVDRGGEVGCEELRRALPRIRPRLHVFGHIHEAYGQLHLDGTHFVNAASCDLHYKPVHPPVVVDLQPLLPSS